MDVLFGSSRLLLRRYAARCTAPPCSGAGSGRSLRGHPSPPWARTTARAPSCRSPVRDGASRAVGACELCEPRPYIAAITLRGAFARASRASLGALPRVGARARCCHASRRRNQEPRWEGGRGCPLRERPQPVRLQGRTVTRADRRSGRRELPKGTSSAD